MSRYPLRSLASCVPDNVTETVAISIGEPDRTKSPEYAAYLLVAMATFLWAGSATIAKASFAGKLFGGIGPIDVLTLTQMRTTVSLLLFAPLLLAAGGWRAFVVSPRMALSGMLLGVVGVAGSNYFYYFAMTRTTVATAVVVQYMAPVYVLLWRLFRKQEHWSLARAIAVGLAVGGCVFVVGVGSGAEVKLDRLGLLSAQAAAVSFTLSNIAGGKLATAMGSKLLMVYAMAGAALFWIFINPPSALAAHHYSGREWIFILGFAMVSMLLPYLVYFTALQRIDAGRVIVVSCLEPVFAAILAWLLLHEVLRPLQVAGVGFVIAAIALTQLAQRRAALRSASTA